MSEIAERRITPRAIKHDLAAVKKQIKDLQAEEKWLQDFLDRTTGANGNGNGKVKRTHRGGNKADFRRYVLNALDPEQGQTFNEIADRAEVSGATANRVVRELVKAGEAKCISPDGQRRNREFVRKLVKVRPGEATTASE